MFKDPRPLNKAIRETAAKVLQDGPGAPARFVRRFRDDHASLIPEFNDFMVEQFLTHAGTKAIKHVSRQTERSLGLGQQELPLRYMGKNIPTAVILPTENNGSRWVPRDDMKVADGDKYTEIIETHLKGCSESTENWKEFWSDARPLLVENPGWTTGDAIRHLREQEEADSNAA